MKPKITVYLLMIVLSPLLLPLIVIRLAWVFSLALAEIVVEAL